MKTETPTEDVKPIESTNLFGLRVVDLQRRYRLGYVPAKALHDDLAPHRWQPIETAPRDGTEILATGLDNGTGPTRHTLMARWEKCPHFGDHFTDGSSGSTALEYLTHWMPLPSLPNA